MYKRIMELTDAATDGLDPFAKQKRDSLLAAQESFERMLASPKLQLHHDHHQQHTDQGEDDAVHKMRALVLGSLWGNVADLSLTGGEVVEGGGNGSGLLLADDLAALCDLLLKSMRGRRICIVLDNCGLELLSDLLLTDAILRLVEPACVVFHAKDRPVFVSDVTPPDVDATLTWLEQSCSVKEGQALAARLRGAISSRSLVVEAPSFFTSPLPFWEMPDSLRAQYAACGLVITKGDANYRRLLGDRHWPHSTSFATIMQRYWPTSVAALRTCKSAIIVGVEVDAEAAAASADPDGWLTAGKNGVIQLSVASGSACPPAASQ
jgi:uncharacterized protein with ATP-grasp and redox domains